LWANFQPNTDILELSKEANEFLFLLYFAQRG